MDHSIGLPIIKPAVFFFQVSRCNSLFQFSRTGRVPSFPSVLSHFTVFLSVSSEKPLFFFPSKTSFFYFLLRRLFRVTQPFWGNDLPCIFHAFGFAVFANSVQLYFKLDFTFFSVSGPLLSKLFGTPFPQLFRVRCLFPSRLL